MTSLSLYKFLSLSNIKIMSAVPMLAGVGLMMVCCSSSSVASMMMGGETVEETKPVETEPTEYVYDFIVAEQSARTNKYNIHITDIEADGVRVTPEQLKINQEPEHAKCNSKGGEYDCEGDNYGMNDPEPVDASYKAMTWSGWKEGQGEVGDKVFTITTPSKVKKFKIDYFRPKYVPGWTIKENGTEVLSTSKGENKKTPTPTVVEYTIP
tara:strand:+ start:45 stop:674 length:630 start_codon:yes stop_codon:yes gene_type:complete